MVAALLAGSSAWRLLSLSCKRPGLVGDIYFHVLHPLKNSPDGLPLEAEAVEGIHQWLW